MESFISVASANKALVAAFGSKYPRLKGYISIREGNLNIDIGAPVGFATTWTASFSGTGKYYSTRGATSEEVVSDLLREVAMVAGRENAAKLAKMLSLS